MKIKYERNKVYKGMFIKKDRLFIKRDSSLEIFNIADSIFDPENNINSTNENLPIPADFTLLQNFPNPFNSGTKISYFLPSNSNVKISIYNILGDKVDILNESTETEGWHSLIYSPNSLSSGVYFLSATMNNKTIIKKILYLK